MTRHSEAQGPESAAATVYPVFAGQCYDYDDARRRAPEAWKERPHLGPFDRMEYDPGHPDSVLNWRKVGVYFVSNGYEDIAPKGLGHFERHPDGKAWVYVQPNGLAARVSENWNHPEPPPLPRPEMERRQCGCYKRPHTCSACGTPHWIEIHGVADGYCTYCYRRG